MIDGHRLQSRVLPGFKCHGLKDGHAETGSDICLDYIRVGGADHDVWSYSGSLKSLRNRFSRVELHVVGDQRKLRDIRERRAFAFQQGMPFGSHQAHGNAIRRQHYETLIGTFGAGSDANVDFIGRYQIVDLRRGTLHEAQPNIRVALAKGRNDGEQCVPGVEVRGPDRQPAAVPGLEICRDFLQLVRADQHLPRRVNNILPGLGQADNPVAMAYEYVDSQLLFEEPDLPAHSRLGREERPCCSSDIESAVDDLA